MLFCKIIYIYLSVEGISRKKCVRDRFCNIRIHVLIVIVLLLALIQHRLLSYELTFMEFFRYKTMRILKIKKNIARISVKYRYVKIKYVTIQTQLTADNR